ncbi:hypothetical protein CR513_10080, partial [Mucuna pruriens]
MTKLAIKGSSNYKNWTNSTWKPMRTIRSISRRKEFRVGQKVLLFNSHLKIIAGPTLVVGKMESISLMEPAPSDDTP